MAKANEWSADSQNYAVCGVDRLDVGHGIDEWRISCPEFANGTPERPGYRHYFRGRPALAPFALTGLRLVALRGISKDTAQSYVQNMRSFWIFLDEMDVAAAGAGSSFPDVTDLRQIPGTLWALFKDWLSAQADISNAHMRYYVCKRVFDAAAAQTFGEAAQAHGYPLPVNPFQNATKIRTRATPGLANSYDKEEIQTVAKRLMDYLDATERRLEEGKARVLGADSDPTGHALRELEKLAVSANWNLTKELVPQEILREIPANNAGSRSMPVYDRCLWLTPSRTDIAAAFSLFMLRTGWNWATVRDMSVEDWSRPHPTRPKQIEEIYSRKRRAGGKVQLTYSLRNQRHHPYQLIKLVCTWTEPLRVAVKRQIASLQAKSFDASIRREIARLAALQNRVWIYASKWGRVTSLDGKYYDAVEGIINSDIEKEKDRIRFNQSLTRDSWAAFAYESSGHNLLFTQIALGHKDLRSLLHYLNNKEIRNRHRRDFFTFQNRVLANIGDGVLTPALLLDAALGGGLTLAEAIFLSSGNAKTRHGVLCANPTNPDQSVEPQHRPGELCADQNCLAGCSKAYVTLDCLDFVMGRIMQLNDLRNSMSLPAWANSNFPHDLQFLEQIADRFSVANREQALARAAATSLPALSFMVSAPNLRRIA